MPITVICSCGMKSSAPDEAAGKHGICPQCRARIAIPKQPPVVVEISLQSGMIAGRPGEVWVNDTEKAKWQMFAAVHPYYGFCFQHHTLISYYWPVPHMIGCVCNQKVIKPGQQAEPFADLGAELAKLGPDEQDALVGRNNWKLLVAGLARWSDIVGIAHVREFHEVMDINKLTIPVMIQAGIPEAEAVAAWNLVYTPQRLANDAKRKELVDKLLESGLTIDQITNAVAGRLVDRVTDGAKKRKKKS